MHYELHQTGEAWTVSHEGVELARFDSQQQALADIAARLEADAPQGVPAALSLNFTARKSAG